MPPTAVARAVLLAPWIREVARLGAPAERLLERAGIPPPVVRSPSAVVPMGRALRWVELACRDLGTEHLGLWVGNATSVGDLGGYGQALAGALTVHDYLRRGIALYPTVLRGQWFQLSSRGDQLRLHLRSDWQPGLADHQSCLDTFAITIANLRRFAGPDWGPTTISFGFRPRERLPQDHGLGDGRIIYRPGGSYLEFPRSMLALRLHAAGRALSAGPQAPEAGVPLDLPGLVSLQVRSLLSQGAVPVDMVAASLGMSLRSLQRGLAAQGVSYRRLLDDVRLHEAAKWLEETDKPVTEIALDLGYSNVSNFTRAFRRRTGVAPAPFRAGTGAK